MKVTTVSELTIDGRLALSRGGSSKALFDFYGPELQHWFHAQRAAHDAIMVGAGTVRADDPQLTVRHAAGSSPLRVIPTTDGRLPPDAQILTDGHPTVLAVPRALPAARRAALTAHPSVTLLDCGDTTVDLHHVIEGLARCGVDRLMVEGGSRLLNSFFAANLVSRIILKHIPVLSGSADAPTLLAPLAGGPMAGLSRWRVADWRLIGGVGIAVYEPLDGGAA